MLSISELSDCPGMSNASPNPFGLTTLSCAIACPVTQYLAQTAPSTCPASCNAPSSTDWCKRGAWTPTCLCQSPYAWKSDTNTCVLWCDCGCYGKNNEKYAVGIELDCARVLLALSNAHCSDRHDVARRQLSNVSMYAERRLERHSTAIRRDQ